MDLLPFETSCGTVRFGEYRAEHTLIRMTPSVDQFRACSAIAAAQGITVFNGGYTHHAELLERAVALDPTLSLQIIDPRTLMESLGETDPDTASAFDHLLAVADDALAPFACRPVLRAFEPDDVPAVFAEGPEQSLARSIGAARDQSEGFWKDILGHLDDAIVDADRGSFLCLNERCPVVASLRDIADAGLLRSAVRLLYVQAMLLGRQPLTAEETRSFVDSLGEIVSAASRKETR
jgi:molecular chaperone HtpG